MCRAAATMLLLVVLALSACVKHTVSQFNGCTTVGSTVYCKNESGKFLPKDNDREIYSLYITNSDMTDLTNTDLYSYRNVDNIFIANTSFGVETNILKDLKNLRRLNITNCSLDEGVRNIFPHNAMLEKLSLRGNKITRVTKSLVFQLQHLLVLDLSDNEISFVEDGAFDHMTNLLEVYLEGNALQEIAPEVVARAGDRCAICRMGAEESDKERADETEEVEQRIVQRPCSSREATRCAAGRWLDRLWWRSPVLTLRLRGNPLCNATAHMLEDVEVAWDESGYGGRELTCEMEANKCLLHDRRRLFLLEACGVEEDGNKQQVPQPAHDEFTTAGGIIFLFGTISGIIISGLVIGVVVAMFVKKKTAYLTGRKVDSKNSKAIYETLQPNIAPSDTQSSPLLQQSIIIMEKEKDDFRLPQIEDQGIHERTVAIHTSNKVTQSIEAMPKGDHVTSTQELVMNSSLCSTPDANGDTLLHHAARGRDIQFVDKLLNSGFNLDLQNTMGRTPLHVALLEGNRVAALRMIGYGANLESTDVYGHRPLHVASSKGYVHIVQLLLHNKVDVNCLTNEEMTPLYVASQEGHLEIVESLIKLGAKVDAKNSRGRVALHVAAWHGHPKTVEILVRERKCVNMKDNSGWTPLHSASRKGHHEIVEILLRVNAEVNAITNGGHTPLHKAAKGGHLQTVKELLEHGADVRSRNKDGKTAADIAHAEGHEECLHYLTQQLN